MLGSPGVSSTTPPADVHWNAFGAMMPFSTPLVVLVTASPLMLTYWRGDHAKEKKNMATGPPTVG